jgi:hypothetical protein
MAVFLYMIDPAAFLICGSLATLRPLIEKIWPDLKKNRQNNTTLNEWTHNTAASTSIAGTEGKESKSNSV